MPRKQQLPPISLTTTDISVLALTAILSYAMTPAASAALRDTKGLNAVEYDLATTVQTICPGLATNTAKTAEQQNLSVACTAMVRTANMIQNTGNTDGSLNITEEQLRTGLGELAHEEVLAHGAVARDAGQVQVTNVANRLSALKSGAKPGIALNDGGYDVGLNLADATPSSRMLGGGAGDRPQLSWYVNGGVNFGDKHATSREDGFEYQAGGLTAGADLPIGPNAVVGLAVGYNKLNADIGDATDKASSHGNSLSLYGTLLFAGWSADAILSANRSQYTTTRDLATISWAVNNQQAASLSSMLPSQIEGHANGRQSSAGLGVTRDFVVENYTWSPYFNFSWADTNIESYNESGYSGLELAIGKQSVESVESVMGFDFNKSVSSDAGVLVPQLRFEYHHEFNDSRQNVKASYLYDTTHTVWKAPSDRADRNYFLAGAGISVVSAGGYQSFLYYETAQDLRNMKTYLVLVGVRGEF